MTRRVTFAVLAAIAGAHPIAAAAAAPQHPEYSVRGNTWTCQSPYPLKQLSIYKTRDDWPRDLRDDAKLNGCIPVDRLVDGEQVIAFLGDYAYLCYRAPAAQVGPIAGTQLFSCWYVLTTDLRAGDGSVAQPHYSKASPSPHFFDAP